MIFAIKNHLIPTLLLWMAFTVGSLLAKEALGLSWDLEMDPAVWRQVLLSLIVVGASDVLFHGLLWLIGGRRYLARYTRLVGYFSPQRTPEILASGLLASSEEWLFRGVILQSVAIAIGMPAGLAVSSILFGLCHLVRDRKLELFALWAVWEGILLGLVYVVSGSLLVAMCVHAFHDIAGYVLFAVQRRTGWLLVVESNV